MESSGLQELEQTPGVGIVLTVEFSRSLAGKNLYNNLLQSHRAEFFTLKGIKLLTGIRLTLNAICCPLSEIRATSDEILSTNLAPSF